MGNSPGRIRQVKVNRVSEVAPGGSGEHGRALRVQVKRLANSRARGQQEADTKEGAGERGRRPRRLRAEPSSGHVDADGSVRSEVALKRRRRSGFGALGRGSEAGSSGGMGLNAHPCASDRLLSGEGSVRCASSLRSVRVWPAPRLLRAPTPDSRSVGVPSFVTKFGGRGGGACDSPENV